MNSTAFHVKYNDLDVWAVEVLPWSVVFNNNEPYNLLNLDHLYQPVVRRINPGAPLSAVGTAPIPRSTVGSSATGDLIVALSPAIFPCGLVVSIPSGS